MATDNIQKEILVVTSPRASKEQYSNLVPKSDASSDDVKQGFEEGCWNGLLDEVLPFAIHCTNRKSQLFIWDLYIGQQTICVEIADRPFNFDVFHSVNPYVYLTYCHYS